MKLNPRNNANKFANKHRSMGMALGVAVVLLLIHSAQAQTLVTTCGQTLSTPGQYLLANNLDCTNTSTHGIEITASNVTFHLGGHTMKNDACNQSFDGIVADSGLSNVVIDGGTVSGFNDGIVLYSSNSRASGMTVTSACEFGMAISGANNQVDTSVVTASGVDGIGIGAATGIHIVSNNISGNARLGVDIANNSNGNFVENNVINNNGILDGEQGGIAIFYGVKNLIANNAINNNLNGIELESPGNTVRSNVVSGSVGGGILVVASASPSSVKGNTVLGSGVVDMSDDSPKCGKDKWKMNVFQTDLVAGVSDGGPGVGCIQ